MADEVLFGWRVFLLPRARKVHRVEAAGAQLVGVGGSGAGAGGWGAAVSVADGGPAAGTTVVPGGVTPAFPGLRVVVLAVFATAFIPKYAVVRVPIAVNPLVMIDTTDVELVPPPFTQYTPKIAATAITTSPSATAHSPVQDLVLST